MPDGSGRIFAADPEAVACGAAQIDAIGSLVAEVLTQLNQAASMYVNAGGDGQIGEVIRTKYKPAETDGIGFLKDMGRLLAAHGARTADLSGLLTGVDVSATEAAKGIDGGSSLPSPGQSTPHHAS